MKKLIALILALVCILGLASCAQAEQEKAAETVHNDTTIITESQTEPTSALVLDCKSIQESAAWSFIDPDTVTVLGGEWAYTSEPNGYVALVTFNYANKFDEYETAEYVVLGVFGGEASTVHCLNEYSPYTRKNVLQEFGAIDNQRFTLE